jgi:phosphoserine phosphatase
MKIVVFDLDETLGYFTELGIFWDCLKKYLITYALTQPDIMRRCLMNKNVKKHYVTMTDFRKSLIKLLPHRLIIPIDRSKLLSNFK